MSRITRAVLCAALLAAAVAALPAVASAATAGVTTKGTLEFRGGSGASSLSIRELPDAIEVTDAAGGLRPIRLALAADQCDSVTTTTVRCRHFPARIQRITAVLDAGSDVARDIQTQLPVLIDGGPGNDTYVASNTSFRTKVDFRGGTGLFLDIDVANYAGVAMPVRISNDGVANDGRAGIDADNIAPNIETVVGSSRGDEITGTGAVSFTEVIGGPGDDVLRAGSGSSLVIFRMGAVADGADRIIGGPARSSVDYSDRTRPINATLNFGGADDGEAGERDELVAGHELVHGGSAGDVMRAPAGSRAAHDMRGNAGGDVIDGADGPDRLTGGPGSDAVRGFGGDDEVFVNDNASDAIDCGTGAADTVDVDALDSFNACENGTIGVVGLAPKGQRVTAGSTARLRVSWRHPQSWRKLRRITLRVLDDDRRVGAVLIDPHNRRVTGRGDVRVVPGARIERANETVRARLALRLGRGLAGRRLRIDVEAFDADGARQVEDRAGTIRVVSAGR
jgi:Ca2+-binding RTX toxin-like protein